MIYLIGYQVGDGWHIKIGIAVDPHRRLRQLQTGNPNYYRYSKQFLLVAHGQLNNGCIK